MAAKNIGTKNINQLFNLPDSVTVSGIIRHEHCDEYIVTYPLPEQRVCPHCHSCDCVIKDSGADQTVRHTVSHDRGTLVTFHKVRLLCHSCHHTFYIEPDWVHPCLRMTLALYYKLIHDFMDKTSFRTVADINRVSPALVAEVLASVEFGMPAHLPETLCIDEFKGSSGAWHPGKARWNVTRYHCNIVSGDGGKGYVLDILPQISADFVKAYFRQYPHHERLRVKYFCCDMHNGFLSVAKEIFPHAHICIDMFHVVELVNDAVTAVRLRLQREVDARSDTELWKLLRGSMKTLLVNESDPKKALAARHPNRQAKLTRLFDCFPDLQEAYEALQAFHLVCREPYPMLKRAALTDWIEHYATSPVPEVEHLARRIQHWRGYIHNTWEFGKSNSPAEGLNNNIKVLKRVSYGIHEFDTFRKRVLLCFGAVQLDKSPYTIFREKRNGGKMIF